MKLEGEREAALAEADGVRAAVPLLCPMKTKRIPTQVLYHNSYLRMLLLHYSLTSQEKIQKLEGERTAGMTEADCVRVVVCHWCPRLPDTLPPGKSHTPSPPMPAFHIPFMCCSITGKDQKVGRGARSCIGRS